MKTISINFMRRFFAASMVFVVAFSACERSVDGLSEPDLNKNPDVFIDSFSGGLEYYPYDGSKHTAFSVDAQTTYNNSGASMRFDVPNDTDPNGNFAGAIFRDDNGGRNLTAYNALTFYAKASAGVVVGEAGFGEDFMGSPFQTTLFNLSVSTNWEKIIIPIPDPSKLSSEKGMFRYAAGTQARNGSGYILWVDELKFENISGIGQIRPSILNGATRSVTSFNGATVAVDGTTFTANLPNGRDVTLSTTPSFFNFVSSNPSIATVAPNGIVTVLSEGTTEITATMFEGSNAVVAAGSLSIESLGPFALAPNPPARDASAVRSIFSDAYESAAEINFAPGFGGSTTETTLLTIDGNNVLNYVNNNYTGIVFYDDAIDATAFTTLHIDAFVLTAGTQIGIQIRDIGDNGVVDTDVKTGNPIGDDVDQRTTLSGFQVGVWRSFDIRFAGSLASQRDNIGSLVITGGPNFILDNIYIY